MMNNSELIPSQSSNSSSGLNSDKEKHTEHLTINQKEAIGLLQIGTFLEYFDLMLYVHMAVLLNELFFPKTDPHTTALLSAFAFCSTFVLRPFGALIFGYLGDNLGRKSTVILTTMLMAISCITMANLPTYAQIGISAAWMVTICRMVQGVASLGEIVGAEVYLTESLPVPIRYPYVAFIAVASVLGTAMALVIASLFTSFEMSWRMAFWIGSCVAAIGSVARTRLRETPEFADIKMKRQRQKSLETASKKELVQSKKLMQAAVISKDKKSAQKSGLMFFLIQCAWPICFYFAYIYCGNILKSLGYTAEQVIHQNLAVTLIQLLSLTGVAVLSYWVHPLKILKTKLFLFLIFILICPFVLEYANTPLSIFFLQALTVALAPDSAPAIPVFLVHLPVSRRFTYASFTYALSRAFMYIVTSFGLIYLTTWFGHWGLWLVFVPSIIVFLLGVKHFEQLEFQSA
ncbi:MFS transporter [Candidatus Paracaedibacter symbiosus]|uniref:MFS transporter n=1 Tax=Candidatus Paracaedibacter symbiosus TaxID=244582 RepID=UPI000AB434D1|nr:MFS transporter [Candidatus Paracaedibacter symbiosus]